MIKPELITKLTEERPALSRADLERVVESILQRMLEALAQGDRVELRRFGAFSVRRRPARHARNPKTGEEVDVRPRLLFISEPARR